MQVIPQVADNIVSGQVLKSPTQDAMWREVRPKLRQANRATRKPRSTTGKNDVAKGNRQDPAISPANPPFRYLSDEGSSEGGW